MTTYVPKSVRDDVYRFFFTEGVIACKKDPLGTWTGTLGGKPFRVPSLQVMQLMRSMKSRGLIKEQFSWRHFYWFLNDEGVDYLRKYLFLAADATPNTHKADSRSFEHRDPRAEGRGRGRGEGRGRGMGRGRGRGRGFYNERDNYRTGANTAPAADAAAAAV